MIKKILGVFLVASLIGACSSTRIIEHNEDKVDLGDYKRISWADKPLSGSDVLSLAATDASIRKTVNNGLQAKGYAMGGERPEVLVSWRLGHQEVKKPEQEVHTIDESLGDASRMDRTHDADVFAGSSEYVSVDVLVLMFADANTRKPLVTLEVRGVRNEEASPQEQQDKLVKALNKALNKIPMAK